MIQLIIFAALAGVVLYQLYAVLGRRVGRQPGDNPKPDLTTTVPADPELAIEDHNPMGVQLSGLAALKAKDSSFDPGKFLGGARNAYEMIVRAFAAGDRETLKGLLSDDVLKSFEAAISDRETRGRTEVVEFLHPPRADIEKADLQGDLARISVRFLAEYRSRTKGPEGEGVDDRRTAELWLFERNLKDRDPNWILAHVGAAEA